MGRRRGRRGGGWLGRSRLRLLRLRDGVSEGVEVWRCGGVTDEVVEVQFYLLGRL